MILNIGLDISKDTIDVAIPKIKRNEITGYRSSRVSNNKKGYALLEKDVLKQANAGFEVRLTAETTGIYSFPVMDFFARRGVHCNEVHAYAIKRHKQAIGSKNKTDKADARDISDYGYRYQDKLKHPYVARTAELLELAMLMSLYNKVDKIDKAIKGVNHAYGFLEDKVDFNFESASNALNHMVDKHSRETKAFHKSLTKYCKDKFKETYAYVTTIPGVGEKIMPYLLNYTHDFRRFSTSRDFTSYIGVVPNYFESGTSVKGKPKIAHKTMCNNTLRAKLTQSANIAMRHNRQIMALVARLSHLTWKQQLIAATRKLAIQIHHIGTDKVCYDPKI